MATEWLEQYVQRIKKLRLGELTAELVDLKLDERLAGEGEKLSKKAERALKLDTLCNEINNRETGRSKADPNPIKKVSSLKGFI